MLLDGRPDDLTINSNTFDATGTLFAGGGFVQWRTERLLSDVVNDGSVFNTAFSLNPGTVFSSFIITHAFVAVKDFTGGAGTIDVSVGLSTTPYDDLVLPVTCTPGGADIIRGYLPAHLGATLAGGGAFEWALDDSPTIGFSIDGTAYTGTPTGGKIIAVVIGIPLDGMIMP